MLVGLGYWMFKDQTSGFSRAVSTLWNKHYSINVCVVFLLILKLTLNSMCTLLFLTSFEAAQEGVVKPNGGGRHDTIFGQMATFVSDVETPAAMKSDGTNVSITRIVLVFGELWFHSNRASGF